VQLIDKIEYKGIEDILLNASFYKNKFINEGLIVFKNANITHEEQMRLHQEIGNILGWQSLISDPNPEILPKLLEYQENHAHNIKIKTATEEDILLDWHIEHCYYDNPIVGATWNMKIFNTDSKNGQTYFVDTSDIYDKMPKNWKNLLDKCFLYLPALDINKFKIIKPHWITGLPVIRIIFKKGILLKNIHNFTDFNGNPLSITEQEDLKKIINFIIEEVKDNKNNRKIQQWSQGDLVIVDMFKLAHAVSGGFDPKDREFMGIWGWQFANRSSSDIKILENINNK
jgi:alpha-ketoglutarate-dependent taurine dioxygenase